MALYYFNRPLGEATSLTGSLLSYILLTFLGGSILLQSSMTIIYFVNQKTGLVVDPTAYLLYSCVSASIMLVLLSFINNHSNQVKIASTGIMAVALIYSRPMLSFAQDLDISLLFLIGFLNTVGLIFTNFRNNQIADRLHDIIGYGVTSVSWTELLKAYVEMGNARQEKF